jgi:hypothetical protein
MAEREKQGESGPEGEDRPLSPEAVPGQSAVELPMSAEVWAQARAEVGADGAAAAQSVPEGMTASLVPGRAPSGTSASGKKAAKGGKRRQPVSVGELGAISPAILQASAERFSKRKEQRELSRKRKLAYLISLEVRRIVEDLESREQLLIEVWSKMRIRQPLLNVLRTRYEQLAAEDLLLLSAPSLTLLERFYRRVDAFSLYVQVTEDMPMTMASAYVRFRLDIAQVARALIFHLEEQHRYEDELGEGPLAGALMEEDG